LGSSCKKISLFLLLLSVPLSGPSAQEMDSAPPGESSVTAERQQPPDPGFEGSETSAAASSQAADAESVEDPVPPSDETFGQKLPLQWKFYWHEGLHFWLQQKPMISPEARFLYALRPKPRLEGKVGALLHVDAAAFADDDTFEGFSNDIELRRFRLYTRGSFFLWLPVFFSFQFEITVDEFFLHDVYFQLREIPLIQTFTFGYLKAPFSMERLESARDTTFQERASPVQAFAPGFKAGFKVGGSRLENRLTWAFGYFADGQDADIGDVTSSNFRLAGRATGLVFHEKDFQTNRLMHLGINYSYVDAAENNVQYKSRPECHIAPIAVDTGPILANNANLIGGEVAFVMNSLSFQGEYIRSFVDPEEGDGLQFAGYYAYVSYFPTGETQPYDTTQGVFTRVRPKRNLSFRNRTCGGVEIYARYSHLDLSDRVVEGGRMNIGMTGLTWYPYPIFKIRFSYGLADINNTEGDGVVHIFQARFEVNL